MGPLWQDQLEATLANTRRQRAAHPRDHTGAREWLLRERSPARGERGATTLDAGRQESHENDTANWFQEITPSGRFSLTQMGTSSIMEAGSPPESRLTMQRQ